MEDDDQRGLAHFLEHMAFNGSRNVPEGEMIPLLQRHGLSFGAHTNAYTSFDETVYMLDAPNVEHETVDTAFMLLRELASNLTLAPDAVDRERGVILSEERARNSPDLRATQAMWNTLFPNARFTARMPIGTVGVIQSAPADRLRDLYESYYRPERAFLVVSGDIDPDQIQAQIELAFGDWRANRADPGDPQLGNGNGGAQSGYFYDPGVATRIELRAVRPALREANTSENIRRYLTRLVANGIVSRRLARLARAPTSPFQAALVNDEETYDTMAVSTVSLIARSANWEAALQSGEQEVRRALQHGFSQAELDEVVARLRNTFATNALQANTRTSAQIADEIAGEFGRWNVDLSPAQEAALVNQVTDELTPRAAQQAFREEWAGISPQVFVISNTRIANAEQRIAQALASSRLVAVTAPVETTSAQFAYSTSGPAGQVAERREIADLGITTVRYANNVRLNIKHTDFTDDSILVTVRLGGGRLELPASAPGLDILLSTLTEGGLEAHSADELESILAGRNVGASMGVSDDAFLFSGVTTPNDLELELQLVAAYLSHPGYREEGVERFRRIIAIQYPTISSSPAGVAQRDVARLLRSNDSRYGIPSAAELTARTYQELRAALHRSTTQGSIEIGIVGDVDVNHAIELVARTFGTLPTRENDPEFATERQLRFPEGTHEVHVLHHEGQRNRAMALTYWPTTDDRDARRMRTLELLRAVLSLKLIDRVRETESATYSPSAQAFFSHANPGFGYLGVSLDLEPDNVDRFFDIVDEIATSLAAGDISADELVRARRPIVDQFRNNLEDNRYWDELVAAAQSNTVALEQHRSALADYESVTIADLRNAARHYLVSSRGYRIAIMPSDAD